MEYLDIVNEQGEPTGSIVERSIAHTYGIAHRTSHVWIWREKDGVPQLLLQKRCQQKDSYPGCYDTSSAGHIPAGVDHMTSALRELKEELGVEADAAQLEYCGDRSVSVNSTFHGKAFHDREYARVYLLYLDWEPEDFSIQKEEIEQVLWMDYQECCNAVACGSIPHCIYIEELELLAPMFSRSGEKFSE